MMTRRLVTKTLPSTLLLTMLFAYSAYAQTATMPARIEAVLASPESVFPINEPIHVLVSIKNIGSGVLEIATSRNNDRDYVLIIDDGSKRLELTGKGRDLVDLTRTFSRKTIRLMPGGTIEAKLLVTDKYDLSMPGKYSIQVARHFRDPDGNIKRLVSEPLEVEVR